MHARYGFLSSWRPCRHLHEERVIRASYDRSRIGSPRTQTYAKSCRDAIRCHAPVVWDEIVLGILGSDPALQRMGADANLILRRHSALRRTNTRTARDSNLRLHQIYARRALSDGVLDLDAWVHLDEIEVARVRILQKL